jgi:hypothetical protein
MAGDETRAPIIFVRHPWEAMIPITVRLAVDERSLSYSLYYIVLDHSSIIRGFGFLGY